MAITVRCDCGKKIVVSDALAGREMRCSGCGNTVLVAAGGSAAGKSAAGKGGKARQAGPVFELSGGQKILIGVIAALLLMGCVFYFGPMRVWNQWGDLQPKATENIEDLVIDSLKEHRKQEDTDIGASRFQPTVESRDITFFQPMLAFAMPEKVAFFGRSNKGSFGGNYNTRTGEIDANVSYGGYTVAGLADIKKAQGTFHLLGRMVDGKPEMEIDGKKI